VPCAFTPLLVCYDVLVFRFTRVGPLRKRVAMDPPTVDSKAAAELEMLPMFVESQTTEARAVFPLIWIDFPAAEL